MMRALIVAALALPALAVPGPSIAQEEIGDVATGHAFAQGVCAECHAVERGDTWSPDLRATPFIEIAVRPGLTPMALFAWLQTAHSEMPPLLLEEDEMRDVTAYILSLKGPR